jgi:hypothetical protein
MGAASSKVIDDPRRAAHVATPMDDATITAIIAAVNEQQLVQILLPLLAHLHGQVAEDHKDHEEPLSILDLDCDAGHDTLTLDNSLQRCSLGELE